MSINQDSSIRAPDNSDEWVRIARAATGILVIGLGILFLVFPLATGLAAAVIAPMFLVSAGVVGVSFEAIAIYRGASRFDWLILLFSTLYLLLGFILASSAFEAIFALSIVVAAGILTQAVAAVVAVFLAKGHRVRMIIFATCCWLLAWLSFSQWPLGSLQLAGISLGLNFVSWGLALGWGDIRKSP